MGSVFIPQRPAEETCPAVLPSWRELPPVTSSSWTGDANFQARTARKFLVFLQWTQPRSGQCKAHVLGRGPAHCGPEVFPGLHGQGHVLKHLGSREQPSGKQMSYVTA